VASESLLLSFALDVSRLVRSALLLDLLTVEALPVAELLWLYDD
jgi:hypothetical protein